MPLQGAIVVCWRVRTNFWGVGVVPLQGAIVVCYGVTTNFGGVDAVPLQGAIVVCYGLGGRVTTNFGGVSKRGAIAGCHCSVLSWGKGRVTANFGGVDVVPLQGPIEVCYGLRGG